MGSKLGFHIQQRRHGWPDAVADAVPALVKSLEWGIIDDWLPQEQYDLAKIKRALKWTQHKVFLLGRHVVGSQGLDNPEERAYEFWTRLLDDLSGRDPYLHQRVLARMRLFDAWEGYNEVGTGPDVGNLGRFDALLARRFHQEGIKYAAGGFSVTKPTLAEWPAYCAAILEEEASGRGERPDFFHFHEYWFPPADWSALLDDQGNIDADRMRAATRGYMLHWRELYEHPQMPAKLRLPVLITECGWDQGWPQQVGYRHSTYSDEDYYRWLVWYDQELQKPLHGIDYVVGAAIFTYGHTLQWESFEIDEWAGRGVLNRLRAYLREQNQSPHPWAWQEAWKEADKEYEVQESHFVLMAQNSSIAWRHALDKFLDVFKVTNGQSLDDAVRLAARNHHITLVGTAGSPFGMPQEWEEEIRRRNPRILIDRLHATTVEELKRAADRRAETGDRYGEYQG